MPSSSDHLWQANHNKETCLFLYNTHKYYDWVITTAFYSAIHFVNYKLFPLHIKNDGVNSAFDTFDKYREYLKSTGKPYDSRSKHKIISDLVYDYMNSIYAQYVSIKDLSWNARYNCYKPSQVKCELALKKLEDIEKFCISK